MTPSRLPHQVIKTRNKHSHATCRNNTIVIRLARNLSKTEAREHVESLLQRMRRLLAVEQSKTLVDPFRHLLDGGQSLTVRLATGLGIKITLHPGERTCAQRVRGGWRVTVSPYVRRAALHRLLWNIVAAEAAPRIETLVHQLNQRTLRAPLKKIVVRFATTQWGSCSPRGVIMINAALLFLPPSLLHYVIIHELAHRRIASHSQAYWKLVEEMLPTYGKAYDTLQTYRLPSL
jgi:predicted metal-dependent hydrolase